ncbi:MAG: DUF4325 domain-containing protein, partial [Oxalobacter sp.]|nr:DUF4325 domain-containing protein [Oxalobacter sp.]
QPRYGLGEKREIVRTYCQIQRVDVVDVWETFFRPFFAMTPNVKNIAHYGFTRMLDNAFVHADGGMVTALVCSVGGMLTICIMDDGVGIFAKVEKALHLPDRRMAALELAKGRLAPDIAGKSGESVFLVSHLFDFFAIRANGLQYVRNGASSYNNVPESVTFSADTNQKGTTVVMVIPMGSTASLADVMGRYAKSPAHPVFSATAVPVKLASLGGEELVSREQARRLMDRLDSFEKVVLDFSDVSRIGSGFADEVFRVFAHEYPSVRLDIANASPVVWQTISQARSSLH